MIEKKLVEFASVSALAAEAAKEFLQTISNAIALHGRAMVALSAGKLAPCWMQKLSECEFSDWDKVYFFQVDERVVPEEADLNNFNALSKGLFQRMVIPPEHVFRMNPLSEDAAVRYEEAIRSVPNLRLDDSGHPIFDLIQLCMGSDGHTAGLFPDAMMLSASGWVARTLSHVRNDIHLVPRLTLTLPVINAADHVCFLLCGGDKLEKLRRNWTMPGCFREPYTMVAPQHGKLCFFVTAEDPTCKTCPPGAF